MKKNKNKRPQIKGKLFFIAATLLCLTLSGCIGWDMWRDSIRVESVVNGNTLLLENGINVVLLGLEDTRNSQERLQKLLNTSDGRGRYVWFKKDSSYPEVYYLDEDNNTFYAYANISNDEGEEIGLNGLILREGLSGLCENPYLCDSLSAFISYVDKSDSKVIIVPNPVVKPILDPEVEDIVEKESNNNRNREAHDHSGDQWMSDCSMNCSMLEQAVDYTNSMTKSFANLLASKSEGTYNLGQICEIYSYLRNKWKYVNDPVDNEYVAYASESIQDCNLSGDCDDFAVLMAACLLAVGGEVCINTSQTYNGDGHAFTEVDVSRFSMTEVRDVVEEYFGTYTRIPSTLNYRCEGNHVWLNLDWQTMYPGGNYWANQNYSSWDCYTRDNSRWVCQQIK